MPTIKPGSPGFVPPSTTVDSVAEVRPAEPSTPPASAQPLQTPDLPAAKPSTALRQTQGPAVESATLQSIADLKLLDSFGSGARCVPLRPGTQSLGDAPLDAEVLGQDLHALLVEGAGGDPAKLAAIQALADVYPGGMEALGAVTLDAKKEPTS